jgi:hypothetical protein
LGHKQGVKGTILYDLASKEIFLSRNVTHFDHILPYTSSTSQPQWHYHISYDPILPEPDNSTMSSAPLTSNSDTHTLNPVNPVITLQNESCDNPCNTDECTPQSNDLPDTSNISNSSPNPSTRPVRTKHAPTYLSDFVCNNSIASSESSSPGILYPISSYHSFTNLSSHHHAYTVSITHSTEPKSYSEACKIESWQRAMNDELEALAKTGTWIFVDLPPLVKPIGNKWVYKVKHKADGTIERYKTRLVAKGYNQIEGLDFFDTFSPVAKLTTVRL